MDARPIGVFDSGAGGLTVLHECLVTMPHEDFVYLGDHARLPYGPRPLDELRRFALEIGTFLQDQGIKLLVAACNAETLERKGIENDAAREGDYRFLTTGDADVFRELGERFLQLPLAEVERVAIAELQAAIA